MANAVKKIQVAVADDHTLMRNALSRLVATFEDYTVLFEANNGLEVKEKLSQLIIPDIVLLDINMPGMDGYQTVKWIHKSYPQVKVLTLSMLNDETAIIRMLRLGAKGYILKNADPEELRLALDSVMKKDFYLSEYISGKIISGLHKDAGREEAPVVLSEKEKEFLVLICSELTYRDIALKMYVSPRTVDEYRNVLFEKLHVHTRVGLAMYAVRHGLVEV
ncbi:MAG: response regulator transcription factor [Chitinophagaceae bacterium]|nr:response regulator transcription factor [Chitinophagaceae bacterium]